MSDQRAQPTSPVELDQLLSLTNGFMTSQAISTAAKLKLADLIGGAPKTADELAQAAKAHALSMQRLLRMLTSVGIFTESADGRFHQTPLSEFLRSDHPRSARVLAVMRGSAFLWKPWGELYSAVMTGRSAFEHVFGANIFEYAAAHPEEAEIFNAGMSSASIIDAAAVVAAYDFSRFERIVDVGGGHGALLHAILSANPKLHGILADQPAVVAGATALRTGAIASRCEIVGTDFFRSIPQGADAYIMKWILHNWNDDDALRILNNCRQAIGREGRLLVVDAVLKSPNEHDPGKSMDLNMLVMAPGGRERTEAEFTALLGRAGFSLLRVIPTTGMLSIVESQPV